MRFVKNHAMRLYKPILFLVISILIITTLVAQHTIYQQHLSFSPYNKLTQVSYQHNQGIVHVEQYGYDELFRLTEATTAQYDSLGQQLLNKNQHNTTYQYDINGNMLLLNRQGLTSYTVPTLGLMDSLLYVYGIGDNRLQSVTDYGATTGYTDNASLAQTYQYDANGSLIQDANQGLSVTYNIQNKVTGLISDTGGALQFIHGAHGIKLLQQGINTNGQSQAQTLYLGAVTYQRQGNGAWQLVRILQGNGSYVSTSSASLHYQYDVRDHLGNAHLVMSDVDSNGLLETNNTLQEHWYYPYGLEKTDLSTHAMSNISENKHQYNGGEPGGAIKQRMEQIDLPIDEGQQGQHYTFYRTLDNKLGRWWQVDIKHSPLESPYVSMGNNPVMFTDFLGDSSNPSPSPILLYETDNGGYAIQKSGIKMYTHRNLGVTWSTYFNNELNRQYESIPGVPSTQPNIQNPHGEYDFIDIPNGSVTKNSENSIEDFNIEYLGKRLKIEGLGTLYLARTPNAFTSDPYWVQVVTQHEDDLTKDKRENIVSKLNFYKPLSEESSGMPHAIQLSHVYQFYENQTSYQLMHFWAAGWIASPTSIGQKAKLWDATSRLAGRAIRLAQNMTGLNRAGKIKEAFNIASTYDKLYTNVLFAQKSLGEFKVKLNTSNVDEVNDIIRSVQTKLDEVVNVATEGGRIDPKFLHSVYIEKAFFKLTNNYDVFKRNNLVGLYNQLHAQMKPLDSAVQVLVNSTDDLKVTSTQLKRLQKQLSN